MHELWKGAGQLVQDCGDQRLRLLVHDLFQGGAFEVHDDSNLVDYLLRTVFTLFESLAPDNLKLLDEVFGYDLWLGYFE